MPRKKTIYYGILNLKLVEPKLQTRENYIALVNNIIKFTKQHPIKVYGDYHVVLTNIKQLKEDCYLIEGNRFFQIDNKKFFLEFNGDNIKKITDDKGKPIPLLDDKIKPNAEDLFFLFFPNFHRLIYIYRPLSPYQIQTLFKQLVSKIKDPGEFNAYIETDSDKILEFLQKEDTQIKKISIKFALPNEDDFGEYAKILEEELKNRKADERIVEEKSKHANYKIDKKIEAEIMLATKYGKIEAKYIDEYGNTKELKSAKYPIKKAVEIYIKAPLSQLFDILYTEGKKLFQRMRSNRNE